MALLMEEGSTFEEEKARPEGDVPLTSRFNNKMTVAQIIIYGTLLSVALLFPAVVIARAVLAENLPRIPIALFVSLFISYGVIRFANRR